MMHNPPHPGSILKDEMLASLNLSVTEAASRLAMSRVALSRVLNGKAAISPDLAVRLENAGVSTARAWLSMQANYDLWHAMQNAKADRETQAAESQRHVQQREAFRQANAIVSLEGWQPSPEALAIQERVICGELTHDEAVAAHIAQVMSGQAEG